ncbi:apolipoprotein N-acyltransferase [Halopolyspora algeriensis]|uniref:Apolipoprotein N-acyltransferase n=1 Tax=Halopolyspora algeriensis TaxID=1500506 RepID=A0A368VH41_9ACTN|nr:apolipoprotein N-acyltransferase [Halopolyspora algeriensis]RCW40499.1 apolipoprotein N-acyltransferase [Halopolyspora algeriensis]TQM53782.1 apolipoprotein N-acyltransferase [Halopolyspora algeriensis]
MVVPTVNTRHREQPDGSVTGRRRVRVPAAAVWLRMAVAIAAGVTVYWASPPRNLWWLVPLAFAGFAAVVHGRRARSGAGYGLLFGLAYLLPLLGWLLDFLGTQFGPWPWLGVATAEALFFGLAGAGMARVSRLPAAPVWMAAVFVGAELLRSTVPFGGFPWGRLAFTQAGGALLPIAALGGAGMVTFAVALLGAALAEFGRRVPHVRRTPRTLLAPTMAAVVPIVAALAATPLVTAEANAGTARVAVIQGDAPNIGLGLLHEDEVLYRNHIRAAEKLVADVRSGRLPRPDLVILPEQVGSWGPARNDPALDRIASRLGVPLVVGGLARSADGELSNRILQWDPQEGATDEYVKQHLVPFAEKIPMRSVAGVVSPFVQRFPQDMVPGDDPGVFETGPARLGVGLCYDVAFGDVFRGATRAGATLLAVPTNNAWYGRSEMSYQQLAMTRLRTVEHSRAAVVAATSGVSAIVQPDGTVTRQTRQFTAQTLMAEVPLRSTLTPATRLGPIPTWTVSALGAAAVGVALWRHRRRAAGAPPGATCEGVGQ